MHFQPIPKRSGLTPEEFKTEFLDTNKPVVFTDLVKDWPATEKWTFDWFKKNYDDRHWSTPGPRTNLITTKCGGL